MSPRCALLLAPLLVVSGCHSYLMPFDDRPLPARTTLETHSGQRLAVAWDGEVMVRPPRGDVGSALGVALFEDDDGVVVSNQLGLRSPLEAGDRLRHVAPLLPNTGQQLVRDYTTLLSFGVTEDIDAFTPRFPVSVRAPLPSAAELRGRVGAHPVKAVSDLRGYLVGQGWLQLDLLVERNGEERVVRVDLAQPKRWLPTRPIQPDRSRFRGLELVEVRDLPSALRPRGAEEGDVLVTRVARGAPIGRAGLRPLDVLPRASADLLLGRGRDLSDEDDPSPFHSTQQHRNTEVSGPPTLEEVLADKGYVRLLARCSDGAVRELKFTPRREPTDLWFPFLFSRQDDGTRWHLGLGPLDVLFHASSDLVYLPLQDRYQRNSRWSFLTLIQGGALRTEQGTVDWGGINFLVDDSRLTYFRDWFDTPRVIHKERGLEGY